MVLTIPIIEILIINRIIDIPIVKDIKISFMLIIALKFGGYYTYHQVLLFYVFVKKANSTVFFSEAAFQYNLFLWKSYVFCLCIYKYYSKK